MDWINDHFKKTMKDDVRYYDSLLEDMILSARSAEYLRSMGFKVPQEEIDLAMLEAAKSASERLSEEEKLEAYMLMVRYNPKNI